LRNRFTSLRFRGEHPLARIFTRPLIPKDAFCEGLGIGNAQALDRPCVKVGLTLSLSSWALRASWRNPHFGASALRFRPFKAKPPSRGHPPLFQAAERASNSNLSKGRKKAFAIPFMLFTITSQLLGHGPFFNPSLLHHGTDR
jgi:hypothetical protein